MFPIKTESRNNSLFPPPFPAPQNPHFISSYSYSCSCSCSCSAIGGTRTQRIGELNELEYSTNWNRARVRVRVRKRPKYRLFSRHLPVGWGHCPVRPIAATHLSYVLMFHIKTESCKESPTVPQSPTIPPIPLRTMVPSYSRKASTKRILLITLPLSKTIPKKTALDETPPDATYSLPVLWMTHFGLLAPPRNGLPATDFNDPTNSD